MTLRQFLKTIGSCAALAVIALGGMLISSPRLKAQEDEASDSNELRIEEGFEIAPVPLNLDGKNRKLVGLGSYIVNAQADCNGCHGIGPPFKTAFLRGHNPYFGQKKKLNPAVYLGGGRDFGPLRPGPSAHIVSRNLTPDKSGLVGGHTFSEFLQIMRTGVDMDQLHPTCSDTINSGCVPPPFKGALLQIMPWYIFQDMTDHDLRAIYEYLRAIPCIEGPAAPSPLHNECE